MSDSRPTEGVDKASSSLKPPPPPLQVKNIIAVLSGKGGVGKSSVAVQLATSLSLLGNRVGLLDVDLCGPSIPRMLNVKSARVKQGKQGWESVIVSDGQGHEIQVMSIGFLLSNQDDAVVWRGPKKNSMIRQFLFNVEWGELDYLIIDTPPGTSDEHIAIAEYLEWYKLQAIIVTTPQLVALVDVEREIGFCQQLKIPMLGIIENMSGYLCPHCSNCTNVFSSEGGLQLSRKHNLTFLGKIPISPQFTRLVEADNANILKDYPVQTPELYKMFTTIANDIKIL